MISKIKATGGAPVSGALFGVPPHNSALSAPRVSVFAPSRKPFCGSPDLCPLRPFAGDVIFVGTKTAPFLHRNGGRFRCNPAISMPCGKAFPVPVPQTIIPIIIMSADSLVPAPSSPADTARPSVTSLPERKKLREELRAAEWAMHRKLMAAAQTALDNFLSNPHRITAQDVARLTELGLELGRSACGLNGRQPEETVPRGPFISLEFRAALEKAYGQPVPPQFIDAESEVTTVSMPPKPNEVPP